jgi:ParB family chromosome partitioning protein
MASPKPSVLEVLDLPVEEITPNPKNPRGGDLGPLEGLAESIGAQGVLQRLIVRPKVDGHYPLVFGHRRLEAAKLAGLTTVPVEIRDYGPAEALAAMYGENFDRQDLTPLQEARAILMMLEEVDNGGRKLFTQRSLAKALGVSQSKISNYAALFKLPGDVVGRLERGALTITEAVLLVRLVKYPARVEAALGDFDEHRDVDMETAVRKQQNDLEREAKVAQTRKELQEAGATIAPDDWRDQGGRKLGDGFHEVDMAVEEHAAEPCHAAIVTYHGEVAYVCTDPNRHQPAEPPAPAAEDRSEHVSDREPTPGTPSAEPPVATGREAPQGEPADPAAEQVPDPLAAEVPVEPSPEMAAASRRMEEARVAAEAARAERERLRRERAEKRELAYQGRTEALRTLLGGRLSRPEAMRLLANFLVTLSYQTMHYDDGYVRHALGLEEQTSEVGKPAVVAFADKSDDTLVRAAVAVVADNVEELLATDEGEPDFTNPLVVLYYGFLSTVAAYKPSEFEETELRGDVEADAEAATTEAPDGEGGTAGEEASATPVDAA